MKKKTEQKEETLEGNLIELITGKTAIATVIKKLGEFTDEGILSFKKDGITVEEHDRAMVSLVYAKIGLECFEKYEIKKPIEIAVNFVDLGNVLNWILRRSYSEVSIKSDGSKLLIQEIDNGKLTGTLYQLPVYLIEEEKQIRYEEIVKDLSNKIIQQTQIKHPEDFRKAVRDYEIFVKDKDASMRIENDGEILWIKFDGELKKLTSRINLLKGKRDKNLKQASEDKKIAKGSYSFELVDKATKGILSRNTLTGFEKAEIKMGTDTPLWITYTNPSSVQLEVFISPRVSRDFEDYDEEIE